MSEQRFNGRKLNRRDFLVLGAAAGAGLALAGCGGGPQNNPAAQGGVGGGGGKEYSGPKVDLEFWNGFTGGDGPFMRQLVEDFSAQHDNINVSMNTIEWLDYYQKVPAAVSSGQGPDIGIMHIDTLATNAARAVILPLDDVANSLGLKESDFPSVVWNAGVYNGKRYGIPLDAYSMGFFYNKALMEKAGLDPDKPPQTRDDYEAALEQLKGAGVSGMWIETPPPLPAWQFDALLWQFGGDLFNSDATQATFNSDAGVEALTWMVDLVKNGHSPKNVGTDSSLVAFQNNENAFFWNGPWNIPTLSEVEGLEWGVTQMPLIGSEKATWANSHNFVMLRQQTPDENRLQASKVFINWISQRSAEWAKAGQVPARKSARESSIFASLPEQRQFAEQLPYVHFPPATPGIRDVEESALGPAVNEALLLKKEPKAALDEWASRADQILEDNRQKYQAS